MRRIAALIGAVGLGFLAGWVAGRPTDVVPERVVRWVRGVDRVVAVPTARADPVSADCADQHALAIALLALPDDVPLAPPASEGACRGRVELAAAITTARQLEALGRPRPFPPDLPDAYREPAFAAVARRVVEACPELGLDLRKVDCRELPCLALYVRPADRSSATSCPAWREAWGDAAVSTSTGLLVGPDGEPLAYELVGPEIPREFLPPEPEPAPEEVVFAENNATNRLRLRSQEAHDELIADLGARELTTAEQRERERRFWQDRAAEGAEGAAWILERLEAQWAEEDARAAPPR